MSIFTLFKRTLGLLLCGSILAGLGASPASAELLRIIHTNDLHSYLETSEMDGWGGYAAVKTTIEKLRAQARSEGIEPIVLDAGDFSEGSQFFFSDHGRQSWKIMDSMGYDAIVVGNHDWLIGAGQLNSIFASMNGGAGPRTPFLASNLSIDGKKFPNFRRGVHPSIEIRRGNLGVAILGVTTNELVYRWRMNGGGIEDPNKTAAKHATALKARNDVVIALTHIGVMKDLKLAGATRGIDVIIGGHSHTKLDIPLSAKNPDGIPVPIAQSGKHGQWVGVMTLDVTKGRPVEVVRYELVGVRTEDAGAPESTPIQELVTEARSQLESRYTPQWLYDVVGTSSVDLERPQNTYTQWGNFVLETMRTAAGADLAVDAGQFYGPTIPAGMITHETIMHSYPRTFDVNQSLGWNVWKVKVPGWLLNLVIKYVTSNGLHLNISGVTFDTRSTADGVDVSNVKIKGRKLKNAKIYTLAVSEGIGRGAMEISVLLRLAFQPKNTGRPIWSILAEKLRQTGGSIGTSSYLTPAYFAGGDAQH